MEKTTEKSTEKSKEKSNEKPNEKSTDKSSDKFIVKKSPPLSGTIKISGAKNSALPVLAATLLTDEKCIVHDIPVLSDVMIMRELLGTMGAKTGWNKRSGAFTVVADNIVAGEPDHNLVSRMRASFLIMGALLPRLGTVKLPLPGGCAIGQRPVDLHLKGLRALGADIKNEHGYIKATIKKLKGADIYLDFPSVGATENIMMAAATAKGQTTIENCAVEPEVVDLANFLNTLGAKISGAGTDAIRIEGAKYLHGGAHTIIPDRIEAGTFMVASAITKGDITLNNIVYDHLKPVTAKLRESNMEVEETTDGLRVFYNTKKRLRAIDLKTLPYPGFPTDMQAQFMGLLSLCEGTSVVTETVFENRFLHIGELKRMGANIRIESRSAVIEGVNKLAGAQVAATDLRAGAALILLGLAADGTSEVRDIFHVDRGYYNFDKKLKTLGANIRRISE